MKKTLSLILAAAGLVSLLSGCGKDPQSSTTTSSVPESSQTESLAASSQTLSLPTPQFESTEITASRATVDGAKTFTVDNELRAKYYDYFAPSYFLLFPRTDFDSPAQMSDDDKVTFAVKCANPLAYTPETGLAIYEYEEIQYTCLKYLGSQINDLATVTMFGFDPGTYHFIDTARYGAFYYFYRLEELSVDASGVYTGVFNVYQKAFSSPENYEAAAKQSRTDILAEQVDTASYKEFSTVTLQFVEMKETDGKTYYQYVSLHTVKK